MNVGAPTLLDIRSVAGQEGFEWSVFVQEIPEGDGQKLQRWTSQSCEGLVQINEHSYYKWAILFFVKEEDARIFYLTWK